MYKEYKQVASFLKEAVLLMDTSKTWKDIFTLTFTRNDKNKAVIFFNDKGKLISYSYRVLKNNTLYVANYLNEELKDKEKHLPIILKMSNSPLWISCFYSILMNGFKPLLVDAKASKEGVENLAKQAKAVAIITDDTFSYSIRKIRSEELEGLEKVVLENPIWEDEVIFCSSGTTGDVKMMVFNGENFCHQICASLNMAEETKDIMYPKKLGDLRILAMVPFHHIFGFVAVFLWYTFYGKTLLFPISNTPSDLQEICQKGKATHIYSVPLFWDAIAQNITRKIDLLGDKKKEMLSKLIAYNLGKISKAEAGISAKSIVRKAVQKMLLGPNVRFSISGGGFLSSETLATINGLGYNLHNGFGMTEIGVTSVELSENVNVRLKARIGHPFYGVEYKISNPNENGEGELMVKSPTIHIKEIIGGIIQPTILDEDGFFKTGDIASKDEDNTFSLKGRIKDIIINADGENIFPDELELFFKKLPHVNQLTVVGIKTGKGHEEKVVLVLETDNQVTDDELQHIQKLVKEIEPSLPHKTTISNIFLAKGKLPLANNMKVKRFQVKKAIEQENGDYIAINQTKDIIKFEGFDEETIKNILIPMRKLFSKVLILAEYKITDDGHWINDLGGDSMSYVELINLVQDYYKVTLPEECLGKLSCINDFVYQVAQLKKSDNK